MTKNRIIEIFNYLKINPKHYSLNGDLLSDGYKLYQDGEIFKIFYLENRIKKEERTFYTEYDALEFFLKFVATDPNVRKIDKINNYENVFFNTSIKLTKEVLLKLLDKLEILPSSYSLNHEFRDDNYILSVENGKWYVYHLERGEKHNEKIFDSEDEACRHFLTYIAVDPSVRK